jgi:putative FmdB family regulatory protein
MPIYAYKCESCGFAKDVLQKMSDAQLTDCPSCGASAFKKQLTAAGFQLKGSGWYATDFKGGGVAANPAAPDSAGAAVPAADGAKPIESSIAKPAAPAPSPAAAPGGGGSSARP